ncbi:MAG: carbohydrate ABC transporter permease [Micrococcales bacterium]|nr:carbohydrate ABC transporter permease [Micrococcales bacterium]
MRRLATRISVIVALLIATVVAVFPVFVTVVTAFTPSQETNKWPPHLFPASWTLSNFAALGSLIPIGRQALNSVIFAGGVTVLSLTFDTLAAYALARIDFRGRRVVFVVMVTTMMIPFQALLIPLYQFLTRLGLVGSLAGMIVPRAADVAGIFLLRQFFVALPRDLDNAARIDGAGELRVLFSIILPNAGPALLTLGLFNFVGNWNDLLWPLIMTSGADGRPLTAGVAALKGSISATTPYGVLMAGSLLAMIPLVVIFLLVQRRFIEGVTASGFKG